MLLLLKDDIMWTGDCSCKASQISRRTAGVAVAVHAIVGTPGNFRILCTRCKYASLQIQMSERLLDCCLPGCTIGNVGVCDMAYMPEVMSQLTYAVCLQEGTHHLSLEW